MNRLAHFLIFLVLAGLPFVAQAQESPRTISVSAVGEVTLPPDMARVILGVTAEAKSSRDALDGAGRTMRAILDFVKAQEIEASDIQTDAIRLNPRYGHNANGQIDNGSSLATPPKRLSV